MFQRTDDPVRDADHYNREMEDRPTKTYSGSVTIHISLDCYGKNESEAEDDLRIRAEDIRDYLLSMRTQEDIEIEIERTHVGEEIE